ncbi:hypothetical protein [Wenyingzhuangia sp. 2_MG-2023]|uniref:hypothetical protein n=1 Tax=Wenyingzhuangia sp. 2_MG-2023 TaxID=3062639 RepID=UPI0026E20074|nr:hypothetical protein [Wenyingzhuangia sp. 2_MG-2023]MDO6739401.1 hypothetical protein [Wenyingzhuangia sp. 2_MG-2023]
MKILKAGTKITTVIGGIEAFIVGVCITMETVEYRVRYFHNGEEKTTWLYRYEIEVAKPKQQAGFGAKQVNQNNDSEILLMQG